MKLLDLGPRRLAPGVKLTPLGRGGASQVVRIDFEPGSVLPGHPAGRPQLFVIARGRGWVRAGEDGERVQLDEGQAAVFDPGEWHESGSEEWMTAIVLEAEQLDLPEPK